MSEKTSNPYTPGHPWFYVLGGPVQPPSVILVSVKERGYQGYRDDIDVADKREEPQRSAELRRIRDDVRAEFWKDISRYREVVRDLHRYRADRTPDEKPEYAEVHGNVSLKHNHLFNDFAHLLKLDDLLSQQADLFDF